MEVTNTVIVYRAMTDHIDIVTVMCSTLCDLPDLLGYIFQMAIELGIGDSRY